MGGSEHCGDSVGGVGDLVPSCLSCFPGQLPIHIVQEGGETLRGHRYIIFLPKSDHVTVFHVATQNEGLDLSCRPRAAVSPLLQKGLHYEGKRAQIKQGQSS